MYAEVRGQVQNFGHTILEGAASGPTMIPGVQFRVAAGWEKQTDGWLKNTVPGQPNEGNIIDQKIWEGQLKFHFNDRFDGWMKLSGIDWHNEGGGPGSRNTYDLVSQPKPGTSTLLNPALVPNGAQLLSNSFPTYLAATGGLTPTSGYACLPTALTGVTNIVTSHGISLAQACNQAAQKDPPNLPVDVPSHFSVTQ